MKILGLDMSTTSTGWAFFDEELDGYGVFQSNEKDIYLRLFHMRESIKVIIEMKTPDMIVFEEVPISDKKNLMTAKNLCLLQGLIIGLCDDMKIPFKAVEPSHWRSKVGVNKSTYTCDKCGHQFESKSGLKHLECFECGNTAFSRFRKTQLNTREELKLRAINEVNEKFGLELVYKKRSKNSQDDIAEAILIALSERKLDGNI